MSYYYAAIGYDGAKTKRVSTTFALCSHALQAQKENYGESTGEGGGGEDAQRLSRAGEEKKLCVIRTKKDRTGDSGPPAKGMRSADDDNTMLSWPKKTPALDRTTTGKIPKQNKKN